MGIPGYSNNYSYNYADSEYYDWASGMVGVIGDTSREVLDTIKALRQEVVENANFNIITTDGLVDLSKVRAPTISELQSRDYVIVVWGDREAPLLSGVPHDGDRLRAQFSGSGSAASAYIDGKFHIFLGAAADAFKAEWSLPSAMALIAPNLYISYAYPTSDSLNNSDKLITYQFVATFMTKWGETGPSNVVHYSTTSLDWNVTLEVVEEDIPNYATSVKYYRFFDTFRLVSEVTI